MIRISLVFFLVLTLIVGLPVRESAPMVQEVALSRSTLEMVNGDSSVALFVSITPANARNKQVAWASSDESVAKVSAQGLVTPVGPGTAEIAVTAVDGGKKATCVVTVVAPVVPVTGVTLYPSALSMTLGDQPRQLVATLTPGDATNQQVVWRSNKPEVADVDANGVVTAFLVGQAEISVVTVDGENLAVAQVMVTAKVVEAPQEPIPSPVIPIAAIAAGWEHTIVLSSGGTVLQIAGGDNTVVPAGPLTIDNVKAVAAGRWHSLALKTDGTVWAWGDNDWGQLGDGTSTPRSAPVQVMGLDNVVAIAGGKVFSYAIKSDGTVWAWGDNSQGQLGNGTTTDSTVPVKVDGLSNVKAVRAGLYHGLALKQDGTVWSWGYTGLAPLGTDITVTARLYPVQVAGLSDVTAVSAGGLHNLAIKDDGSLMAWGSNYYGALGDGTVEDKFNPVQVNGLPPVASAIGLEYGSMVLTTTGEVWTWGYNYMGQVGDGTQNNRLSPYRLGSRVIKQIYAGYAHTFALDSKGQMWAWGSNEAAQIGKRTSSPWVLTPTRSPLVLD